MSLPFPCSISHTDVVGECRIENGRAGYNGSPTPKAIVLHPMQGISPEAYEDLIRSPLPKFIAGSTYPKSVHFIVTDNYAIQFAEIADTTFGIDYFLNPTWPGLNPLLPVTDVNGPFIHVALFTSELLTSSLINLLCCINVSLNTNLPIIASSDLQSDRQQLIIDPSLISQVDTCVENGGIDPDPPNIFDLEQRVIALEACCIETRAAIVVLDGRLDVLEPIVAEHETRLDAIDEALEEINEVIAIIPTLQEQINILINQVQNILLNCCPTPPDQTCFRYQLLPGDEMVVTPFQGIWLNLPTKVEDATPPLVITGPLWRARLLDCTWNLEAIVRFRLTGWCIGKKAQLYLVACGEQYLLAETTIASTGSQSITLTGDFLLPPGCTDVHLLVRSTDDDPKVIEFAEFKGCCA